MKCSRCGEQQDEAGKVFPLLVPLLWLFGGFSPLSNLCKSCAGFVNFLGVFFFIAALIVIFVMVVK